MASLEGGVGGAGRGQRPGRRDDRPAEPGRERRPHRLVGVALRRHLQPVPLHAAQARHRGRASSTTPTTSTRGGPPSARTPRRSTPRRIGNPKGDVLDFEGVVEIAHEQRHPAGGRQHPGDALPGPAAARTAPTSSCTRPPSSSAATARRSAASSSTAAPSTTRAAGGSPASPSPTRATTAWCSGSFPSRCFPARFVAEGAAAVPARHRAGDRAVQLVPVPPGPRDAEPAHGAPRAERRSRWPSGSRRATRSSGSRYPGLASSPWHDAPAAVPAPRRRARSWPSASRAAPRPVEASSRASSCSATWPTSATCAAWPSTRRRRRTPSSTEAEQVDDRRHAGPRAALGRHRDDRRHPRRPRRRVPRRRRRDASTASANVPSPASWQPGDDRRATGSSSTLFDDGRPRSRSSAAVRLPAVTVAYETWGSLDADRVNAVLVAARPHRRLPRRRPGGPGPLAAGLVGRRSSARARRSTPTGSSWSAPTCSAAARARPGRRRSARRRHAVRVAVPGHHHPRPGRGGGGAGRPPRHRALGRRRRWVDGRHAGARVGRGVPRAGARGPWSSPCGAAATAEQIALCSLQIRAIRADPHFHGGDYYDAAARPVARLSLARGIGRCQLPHRAASSRSGSAAGTRATRTRSRAAGTPSSRTSSTTATSSRDRFDANSYIVLSEAMNHHDVGRGRGGVARALGAVTAEVTVAGIASDRLYPLAPPARARSASSR